MSIEGLFDWLPAISPEQALTLFVVIDALILLATVVYALRRRQSGGSTPSKTHHKHRPPNLPKKKMYYDVEESEGQTGDLETVAKALSHLSHPNEMPAFPTPSLGGTPQHLKDLVAKSRDPHLFTRTDVVMTPPLPMDERAREVQRQGHNVRNKKKNRDGFVV